MGLIALIFLAACGTEARPVSPTIPFEESLLAYQRSDLVTVVIGQIVQKTDEQEAPSPLQVIGCPCTDQYGFWRIKVERYLANPQPYDEITYKAVEETTRSDGTVVIQVVTQPPPPREGDRAVFFLKRRLSPLYPILTEDTYGGYQAVKLIEDGLVDVGDYGVVHIPEWAPLDEFADSIEALANQPAKRDLNDDLVRCEEEGSLWSSNDIFSYWSIDEIARMSRLAVLGTVGTGRFIKWTILDGVVEEECARPGSSVILYYLVQFEVDEYVKGSGPEQITLILPAEWAGDSPIVKDDDKLDPGEKYLLLPNDSQSAEESFGLNHHRWSYDIPHGKWLIRGDVAVSDYQIDLVMSVEELKSRIATACDATIQPGNEKIVLKNQYCP